MTGDRILGGATANQRRGSEKNISAGRFDGEKKRKRSEGSIVRCDGSRGASQLAFRAPGFLQRQPAFRPRSDRTSGPNLWVKPRPSNPGRRTSAVEPRPSRVPPRPPTAWRCGGVARRGGGGHAPVDGLGGRGMAGGGGGTPRVPAPGTPSRGNPPRGNPPREPAPAAGDPPPPPPPAPRRGRTGPREVDNASPPRRIPGGRFAPGGGWGGDGGGMGGWGARRSAHPPANGPPHLRLDALLAPARAVAPTLRLSGGSPGGEPGGGARGAQGEASGAQRGGAA